MKPSSTQEPTSFRARHTTLILQQRRNITLSTKIQAAKSHTKPTDTSKLTTGHFIASQGEEVQLHPRANKFQGKTYQANSPTKQEHNPEHKNTGSQKSYQTHRHLKTHYWTLHCTPERKIQLHPPEHQCKLPKPGNLDKPLVQTHPQGRTSTIKRNHKLPAYRKATPSTAT